MKLIYLFIFLSMSIASNGSELKQDAADSAYLAHDYETAIALYSALLNDHPLSAPLYYNLGNAYFKNNEIGKAIWSYQKAKKISPQQEDIIYNLNFVSALTEDKTKQSETGISKWLANLFFGRSINFWSFSALFIAAISALLFYFFKVSSNKNKRGGLLASFVVSSSILVTCLLLAFLHYNHINHFSNGIITESMVMVKTAPSDEEAVAFELHEGAKFTLKSSQADWYRIKIGKAEGWVKKSTALLY